MTKPQYSSSFSANDSAIEEAQRLIASCGKLLRRKREEKNISEKDAATHLSVLVTDLRAIEDGRYSISLNDSALRNRLRAYEVMLTLEPGTALELYDEAVLHQRELTVEDVSAPANEAGHGTVFGRFKAVAPLVATGIAAILVMAAWGAIFVLQWSDKARVERMALVEAAAARNAESYALNPGSEDAGTDAGIDAGAIDSGTVDADVIANTAAATAIAANEDAAFSASAPTGLDEPALAYTPDTLPEPAAGPGLDAGLDAQAPGQDEMALPQEEQAPRQEINAPEQDVSAPAEAPTGNELPEWLSASATPSPPVTATESEVAPLESEVASPAGEFGLSEGGEGSEGSEASDGSDTSDLNESAATINAEADNTEAGASGNSDAPDNEGTADSGLVEVPASYQPAQASDATSSDTPLDTLAFNVSDDCWLEVHDTAGKRIFGGIVAAGKSLALEGEAPFKVLVGRSRHASLSFNGQAVPIEVIPRSTSTLLSVARGDDGTTVQTTTIRRKVRRASP